MSVNYEIKSQLAKLLATEDLMVEHKKVETACFNVDTRVLTLPMWDKASNNVYDLLVAHEVGHALFTPNIDWTEKVKINPMFVNIVEDARIEKLMKRKYGGLSKTFYRGYQELNDDDFFSVKEEGVDKYGLADKINLYFKIGNFVDITFKTFDESNIVKMIADAETFDEVLIAAEALYNYCKKEKEQSKIKNLDDHEKSQGSASGEVQDTDQVSSQDTDQGSDEDTDQGGGDMTHEEMLDEAQKRESQNDSDEPEIETMNSLDQKLRDLSNLSGEETQYIEIPDINLDNFVINNKTIHDQIDHYFNTISTGMTEDVFEGSDTEYNQFKKLAQKEVNYLVKEFECKKSADAYARSFTSRTGVLDTSKLHTYRHNEDLFKKVNIVPDGKNHGLIFIIDWSGSMCHYLKDTIKQLYNLVWFCQKVKIPFDVYAFTNSYKCIEYNEDGTSVHPQPHCVKTEGKFHIPTESCVINILTSGKKNNVLDKQMKNIWRNIHAMNSYCGYSMFHRLSLGGTPLNEALISLHKIIPQFKNRNKVQKVQCVVLTDGEGNFLAYTKKVKTYFDGVDDIRPWRMSANCFMRNRKTGHTYQIPLDYIGLTDMFLKDLRQTFSDVNFIGIRILSGNDLSRQLGHYYGPRTTDKMKLIWKKEKSVVIHDSGYHAYFMIQSNSLQTDDSFEVSFDATKTQIKNAFQKSLKSKKMNKKILNEFVELVA